MTVVLFFVALWCKAFLWKIRTCGTALFDEVHNKRNSRSVLTMKIIVTARNKSEPT